MDTGVGTAEVIHDSRRPGGRSLLTDGQVHGHVVLTDPTHLELDYQARLAAIVGALVARPEARVAHLGGGAFAVPRALQAADPTMVQLVVERSAAIIRMAERELGLRRDAVNLAVRKGDARAVLARSPGGSFDVVVGDAFIDSRTPRHLTTVEFMAEVARVLRRDGCYVVNLIDEQPWAVLGAHAAAALTAFADVLAVGSRGVARMRDPGNVFLVASNTQVDRSALASAVLGGAHPSALVPAGQLEALARRERARHDADG